MVGAPVPICFILSLLDVRSHISACSDCIYILTFRKPLFIIKSASLSRYRTLAWATLSQHLLALTQLFLWTIYWTVVSVDLYSFVSFSHLGFGVLSSLTFTFVLLLLYIGCLFVAGTSIIEVCVYLLCIMFSTVPIIRILLAVGFIHWRLGTLRSGLTECVDSWIIIAYLTVLVG